MKTPEQIAEDAAKAVLKAHGLKKNGSRDYITALGWEMGEGVGYELALREIVEAAIEADRRELYQRVLTFEPDAIRDHFEADDDDPTEGLTTAQLDEIGRAALMDDALYEAFHDALVSAISDYRERKFQ